MAVARNLLRVEYKQGSEDGSHPRCRGLRAKPKKPEKQVEFRLNNATPSQIVTKSTLFRVLLYSVKISSHDEGTRANDPLCTTDQLFRSTDQARFLKYS